jgi:endonuclease-3
VARPVKPAKTSPEKAGPGIESPAARKARLQKILARLQQAYPDAHCELDFRTPLELLIATILSAQCTDVRVNQVTPKLFRMYRSAADYAAADPAVLEETIRPTGFFRSKARSIIGCCRKLEQEFGGHVPQALDELVGLPGVGRKTANIVRYNAYGLPGFGVDTHVIRVTDRLGLVDSKDPEEIEAAITAMLPPEAWGHTTHVFIFHGRRTCAARRPACPRCPVGSLCPWPHKTA